MKSLYRVIVLWYIVCCWYVLQQGICFAQMPVPSDFVVERFGLQGDLVNAGVTDIAQDKYGFLWIGTYNGVLRYDGRGFKHYPYVPSDTTSLIAPNVVGVIPDSNDHVWVATTLGLSYLDMRTGKSQTIQCKELSPYRIHHINFPVIFSMTQDAYGHLWLGTAIGAARYTIATGEWRWFSQQHPAHHLHQGDYIYVNKIVCTPDAIWMASDQGEVFRLDTATSAFENMHIGIEQDENPIHDLVVDSDGTLLIATTRFGVVRYDPQSRSIRGMYMKQTMKDDRQTMVAFHSILPVRGTNEIVLGSNNGVYVITRSGMLLHHYTSKRSDPTSLIANQTYKVFCDRSGVWWFGDDAYGLSKYAPLKKKFYHIKRDEYSTNTLTNNYVRGIIRDSYGNLWVGTQFGGLNRYNPSADRWTNMNTAHPANRFTTNIWAVHEDHRGVVWAGIRFYKDISHPADSSMLFSFQNGHANRAVPFRLPKNPTKIVVITEDPEHNLWLGGDGLVRISADRTSVEMIDAREYSENLHEVQTIVFDKKGRMWCGSLLGGLMQYDRTAKKIRVMPLTMTEYNQSIQDRAKVDFVSHILETKDGTIWVSTKGKGLFRYREATDDFENIAIEHGLPTNVLYAALEDERGTLWISSDKGLLSFQPTTRACRVYGVHDGLQGTEYNRTSFFKDTDGTMYFGGTNGFNIFHPAYVRDNQADPNVHITMLKIDTMVIDLPRMDKVITLYFEHHNTVRFEFSSLEFTDPMATLYSCKLEGFDVAWRPLTDQNFIEFINLPPGEYAFAVRARNADGTWSSVPTKLHLTVLPAWWQTVWFYAMCVILGIGCLVVVIRWRVQVLRERSYQLEMIVQERTRELREQTILLEQQNQCLAELNNEKNEFLAITAHDLKNPLAGISGLAEMMLEDEAMPRASINHMLTAIMNSSMRMFDLIKNLLDVNAIEQGAIKPHCLSHDVNVSVRHVVGGYFTMAEKKGSRIEGHEDTEVLAVTDSAFLMQILDNLVSNAIKYSLSDSVIVIATRRIHHDAVAIEVRDQGLGMSEDDLRRVFGKFQRLSASPTGNETSNGLGLSIVRSLVHMLDGEITVHSAGKNQGTTFTVILPSAEHIVPIDARSVV